MKIRRLKTILTRRGYTVRSGKGSHCIWTHPSLPGRPIVLAGGNNEDAHPYQIARVCRGQHHHRSTCLYDSQKHHEQ